MERDAASTANRGCSSAHPGEVNAARKEWRGRTWYRLPGRTRKTRSGLVEVAGSSSALAPGNHLSAKDREKNDGDRDRQKRQCTGVMTELNILIDRERDRHCSARNHSRHD